MSDKEFLDAVRKYIEECESTIENEWGSCRPLDELILNGKMPRLYYVVLRALRAQPKD